MHNEHSCHPTMATYLYDLESKIGLPIRYQRWQTRYTGSAPFRREIELVGTLPGTTDAFRLPYKDEIRTVEVANSVPPVGKLVELVQGDESFALAAVDGRRVRLAFDLEKLFEQPGDLQPGLILEAILNVALPQAAAEIATYDWQREQAQFAEWMVAGVDNQLSSWKNAIRENDHECNRLTTHITGLVRKNTELQDQIRALQTSTRPECEQRARSEFAALVKMMPSPVVSVDVEHSKLSVVLEPLTLEHDGNDYAMGTYTLQIGVEYVRIWSDKGLRYPHPHVSSDGVPCWGNLGPGIGKLLGEGQFAALISVIWEFLHSYNERDAYRHIETWDPDWEEEE